MTEVEGWDWIYSHASPRKEKLPSICFTGFSQTDKSELSSLATGARLRAVGAVNDSLSFLCVGDNAGPVKLAKAKKYGITIMNRAEYLNFLETGEIPIQAI
jgi:DNA ligase (NAD+)